MHQNKEAINVKRFNRWVAAPRWFIHYSGSSKAIGIEGEHSDELEKKILAGKSVSACVIWYYVVAFYFIPKIVAKGVVERHSGKNKKED
jgi:hypothetical protein